MLVTVIPKDAEEFEQVGILGVRIRSVKVNNCKGIIICITVYHTETWISVDIQGVGTVD